jgi:hypothetical protein
MCPEIPKDTGGSFLEWDALQNEQYVCETKKSLKISSTEK